ncbi:MAG: hypothetical protein P4M12_01575 [Gammaproteobacteria bacterium]|nr:hypothetical protein [Gammaproteobacteria bacterium]
MPVKNGSNSYEGKSITPSEASKQLTVLINKLAKPNGKKGELDSILIYIDRAA